MGHPAKEGLRLWVLVLIFKCHHPRVGHPAKEGLRLGNNCEKYNNDNTQSGSSSKRGIKTDAITTIPTAMISPEWVIQQKRD